MYFLLNKLTLSSFITIVKSFTYINIMKILFCRKLKFCLRKWKINIDTMLWIVTVYWKHLNLFIHIFLPLIICLRGNLINYSLHFTDFVSIRSQPFQNIFCSHSILNFIKLQSKYHSHSPIHRYNFVQLIQR